MESSEKRKKQLRIASKKRREKLIDSGFFFYKRYIKPAWAEELDAKLQEIKDLEAAGITKDK